MELEIGKAIEANRHFRWLNNTNFRRYDDDSYYYGGEFWARFAECVPAKHSSTTTLWCLHRDPPIEQSITQRRSSIECNRRRALLVTKTEHTKAQATSVTLV
jgi:hypothetical protein